MKERVFRLRVESVRPSLPRQARTSLLRASRLIPAQPSLPGRPPAVQIPSRYPQDEEWRRATDASPPKDQVPATLASPQLPDAQIQPRRAARPSHRARVQTPAVVRRAKSAPPSRDKLPRAAVPLAQKTAPAIHCAAATSLQFVPRVCMPIAFGPLNKSAAADLLPACPQSAFHRNAYSPAQRSPARSLSLR